MKNTRHNHGKKILFAALFAAFFMAVASDDARASNSYFDMSETKYSNLEPFPKWTGVRFRFRTQQQISDSKCGVLRYHPCAINDWKELIAEVQDKSLTEKMDIINDWGNEHPYIVDQINWGVNDYWETPYEFMEINGDCEDYAISKYYSLRAAGVSVDRMRIIILQDLNLGGIIHAVLGVYDEDDNLIILDNQIKQLIPALNIYHYRPIYGLNERNWWMYRPH